MSTYPQRQPRRILVVANETVESPAILETLLERRDAADGEASEVMVVVPALNTRLRYWMSDLDHARLAAQWRLMRSLDALRDAGVAAEGCIGDADPFLAMSGHPRRLPGRRDRDRDASRAPVELACP